MRTPIFLLLLAGSLLLPRLAVGTVHQAFESPEPTWQVRERDCALRMEEHRRRFDGAHSGRGCEYFRYWTGRGTQFLLAHGLDKPRVIDELVPSLWVKSNRGGLQLMVRAVLPRTHDPRTGQPMTVLLPGDQYDPPGRWLQLRVENLPQRLADQVRILSARFGHVDAAEAYVDLMVLNAYGGPGEAELWLDDLELSGFASAASSTQQAAAAFEAPSAPEAPQGTFRNPPESGGRRITTQGALVMVDQTPFFARAVQWRGERLAALVELGLNTVCMDRAPTAEQLQEAERLGLWLVGSAPEDGRGAVPTGPALFGWTIGRELSGDRRDEMARRVAAWRARNEGADRPVICEVVRDVPVFADTADILLMPLRPLGTSIDLAGLEQHWRRQRDLAGATTPLWAGIQTAATAVQRIQIDGMHARPTEFHAEPDQIWLQVCHAAAGGARGVYYQTEFRLDSDDPAARQVRAAISMSNHYLSIVEPWLAAGAAGPTAGSELAGWRTATLESERSRLLLVMQRSAHQQFVLGEQPATGPLQLVLPGRRVTDQAYRITPAGVVPLRESSPSHTGQLTLSEPGLAALVVLTDDPLVVSHLGRRSTERRGEMVRIERELVQAQLDETRQVLEVLPSQATAAVSPAALFPQLEAQLRRGDQLYQAGDLPGASQAVRDVAGRLRGLRYTLWQQAALQFPSPVSSPLCGSFRLLPAHWRLAEQLQGVQWGQDHLAAGRFEDLAHLLESGWSQSRGTSPVIGANVELSLESPRTGRMALKLQAWPEHDETATVATWPVWITSARVPVQAGQMVRIHGWAKVPHPLSGSPDGLLIFDSLNGIDLAERIVSTRGWQEFTLYRIAPAGGDLTVVFALTGLGTAFVDDVEVTVLR